MATVKTAIALYDGVTSPLKSMMKVMNIVISSFEAMQAASAKAVDTRAIAEARDELAKAAVAFDSIEESNNKANSETQKLDKNLRGSTVSADGLLSKLAGLGAAIGGAAALQKAVALSDTLSSTRARLNLIVDDGGSVEQLEQKIMASASRSRAAFFDTASAVASMGANAKAAFSGNDELIAFLEQVNKQFAIGGASAQGQAAAMLQLTQAMAAGALRGEELNSILENAPGIARAIEQYMGTAEGSIKSYAEQGLITAEVVKNAMFAAADETNAKFESMPMTWGQIWTGMKNQALTALSPALEEISSFLNSSQFEVIAGQIANGFAVIGQAALGAVQAVAGVAGFIADHWPVIAPIVATAAAAFITYKAVTLAVAAAQWLWNAAMAASPLTWIIIGATALAAVIAVVAGWIARTTGIAQTGFGVVAGGINVAVQAVWNAFLVVANVALAIWDALGALNDNIGTAFSNTIKNVQGWFYGLLSTVLTVVAGICEALNKLPFVEFDYSGITGKADEYARKSAAAYGGKGEYQDIGAAWDKGFHTFDAFSSGWAEDAFSAGASWGDGISAKVGGFFKSGGLFDGMGLDSALSGIAASSADTAANTAAAADALEIAEEDLRFMRDLAEREAVNRYATAEVRIEQNNTNYIDKDTDLDGLMERWTSEFAERMDVSGENVPAF